MIVSELYPPDGSINGRRLHALAVGLVGSHIDVSVITSHPHYRTGRTETGAADRELMDGVPVRRLHTLAFGKGNLVARGMTALIFAAAAFVAVISFRPVPKVVLSMSPSLFTGAAAGLAARLRGAAFVYDVEDFHPDVAIEVGAVTGQPLIFVLRTLEQLVLLLASHLVVISEGFRDVALSRGVSSSQISVITNWADPGFFDVPVSRGNSTVRAVFVGTHGLAQDLDVLIDAAALCQDEVTFTFVGDGVAKANAIRRAAGLSNVRFVPSQTHQNVVLVVAEADIALVALRPGRTLAATIPSKTYEYLAGARPILAVAGFEVERLIDGAGICLPQGSRASAVAAALRELLDESRRLRMADRARVIARPFSRDRVVAQYVQLVERLVGEQKA